MMNGWTFLFKDSFFWIGLAIFLCAIGGLIWILKQLQREERHETFMPELELPSAEPMAETSDATVRIVKESKEQPPAQVTLESLAEQMNRMEKTLMKITEKLDQPGGSEVVAELEAIMQSLKSMPMSGDSGSINQLSAKMDKIYKVLSALSGSEEK